MVHNKSYEEVLKCISKTEDTITKVRIEEMISKTDLSEYIKNNIEQLIYSLDDNKKQQLNEILKNIK